MTEPVRLVTSKYEPDKQAVAVLEEALKDAREGLVTDVIVVMSRHDIQWGWMSSGSNNFPAMIGQFEIAKHEILHEVRDHRCGPAA